MTTSNKNFKVKNGLEVLGTFATVNGNEVLTSASILDALANVDTTGITNGETIIYDEATLTFIPGTASGGGASVIVSDTAPPDPELNTLWYHSNSGALFIRLGDVDSNQWVQVGMTGPQGIQGEPGILAQATAPVDTTVLWLDTDESGIGIPLGGTAGQALVKADSANFNTVWASVYTETETDNLLDSKSDTSHLHDDRYYTETETDTLLSGKSDTSHTHDDRYYTESEVDTFLSSKSDTSHLHDDRYYTESETDNAISTAISSLVDSSPAVLDTLNEISAALNSDPSFASTMSTQLNLKAPKEDPTFTGTVSLPATTSIGNVSGTEIGYIDGVTSGIQAQLNAISTALNKLNSWGAKEGPVSLAAAYRNNWQMGQHQGVGIDATSYGDGIMINETGYYECLAYQRSDGTNIYIGLGINGDRAALEERSTGIWGHDHSTVSGGWSKTYYIGLLNAGEKITAGSSGSATGLTYGSTGYAGLISVKRLR